MNHLNHLNQLFIGGQWVDALEPTTIELINPATEQPFATCVLGGTADVDRAVDAARNAFESFRKTSAADRIALLQRIIAEFIAREDQLMAAVTADIGTPTRQRNQVSPQEFQQAVEILKDYKFDSWLGNNIVRREPIGVCGLISAWNSPIHSVTMKCASAFAAGCAVILKPSEFNSASGTALSELFEAAGVPAGVFNLVRGTGPVVGAYLSAHPGVEMISFTGSTRVGVEVSQLAARTIKRVALELGGKSAHIILPDADLAKAVAFNVRRGFANSGQSCHCPSRILVHRAQRDAAIDLIRSEVAQMKVGDPTDPSTVMGPVATAAQYNRVQSFIESGLQQGASAVCGGTGKPEGLNQGFFVRPTVFSDVTPDMKIAQEEIFGPVLSMLTYETDEEAIAISNATVYGLGAYVSSADPERALNVGREMRAGSVFYNGAPSNAVSPMGGYKQSGNGRERGVFGLEEFLEVKGMVGFRA